MWVKNDRIKKEKKNPGKDKWGKIGVVPLMPLVGVNHCQPILHMSKIMFHCYSTDEIINKFSIGYMINPSLNCNKLFREQVEKFSSVSFHKNTMETIKDCLRENNTCVMALIIFMRIMDKNQKKCIEC